MEFLNEIQHFKIRLEILENERYELEEKVRQLQSENTNYKTRLINDNIGFQFPSTLNGHLIPSSVAETDIERLKRRIESLVKSNDEKERKIEDLQIQLNNYQSIAFRTRLSKSTDIGNSTRERLTYETDGDLSDSNSVPSLNSEKDLQSSQKPVCDSPGNVHQNPLVKLKLDVLHRAASAEPMLTQEITSSSTRDLSTKPSSSIRNYDQSGYISDGPSQRYSIYKKSLSTNLDKQKSSSTRGLKSIFGRVIRTNSGYLQESSFQRGTIANGKSRSSSKSLSPLEMTFARWQTEQLVNWLFGIGLGQYANECRKYYQNGLQLLNATSHELDKKLGMRNPLHRKKFKLCLNGLSTGQIEANHLDTFWVLKWLDDIGLPQYKEYFSESKIDGRLLHHLTLEDIFHLNITSEIHHLCLKRSIQVLRLNHFNPNFMKRRPTLSEKKNDINEILYWSNHRVMEWLRSIDLSEYAPNLRGSGVCGALIILEIRFNVSTLAEILSIPMSKTLLRRHLSMRFQELIGTDLQTRKNHYEKSANCQPLTLQTKIKFSRGLFAHRRTRSIDTDELICPLNDDVSSNLKLVLTHDSPTTIV